ATLSGFFDTLWQQPLTGLSEATKGSVLNMAGYCLRALGRLLEAAEATQMALAMRTNRKKWKAAAMDANNLSELYVIIGSLPQALKLAQHSVELADRGDD